MLGDLGCILSVVSKMLPASHGVRVVIHTKPLPTQALVPGTGSDAIHFIMYSPKAYWKSKSKNKVGSLNHLVSATRIHPCIHGVDMWLMWI